VTAAIEPDLSLVVLGSDVSAVCESLKRAIGEADDRIEVICVNPAPTPPCCTQSIAALPVGQAYVMNRALVAARGRSVTYLSAWETVGDSWAAAAMNSAGDSRVVVGPGAVRRSAVWPREALLANRGFDETLRGAGRAALESDALSRLLGEGLEVAIDDRLVVVTTGASFRQVFSAGADRGRRMRTSRRFGLRAPTPALGASGRRLVIDRVAWGAGVALGLATRAEAIDSRRASELLREIPPDVREALAGRPVVDRPLRVKAQRKIVFAAGEDAILHLHVHPAVELSRAVEARETIRGRAGVTGIPRVIAAAEGMDSLWVLEERLRGTAPAADPTQWYERVAEWIVGMSGPPGPALREGAEWQRHRSLLLGEDTDRGDGLLAAAVAAVERLPSAHTHGDLQPANVVLLADGGIGAVDWEGAWVHGIPGLDVVYLALMCGETVPNAEVVRQVLADEGRWNGLRPMLARLGVDEAVLRPALAVMLASWAASERRRLMRIGTRRAEPVFRPLYDAFAPELLAEPS
jgi:Phosphotransferase enzyme family